MVLLLTGIDLLSFSICVFLGSNCMSCQPVLETLHSPLVRGLSSSHQQPFSALRSHHPPPQVTRTLRSVSQAIYRGTCTLPPPPKFSWCILRERINSHSVVNKSTALLPVLSTTCATFYNSSLYSAPNSTEPCVLFH